MKQIVIGGLSGSGKTTVLYLLLAIGAVRRGVTFTTRRPREGEAAGIHYDFFAPESIDDAVERGLFAELTTYIGNDTVYGITWQRIRQAEHADLPTLWVLDTVGVERMRELFPANGQVVSIFLYAKPLTLYSRMKERGENEEVAQRRLKRYNEELALGKMHFDHAIDTTEMSAEQVALKVLELVGPLATLYGKGA
jgi:guanylate kinase